MCPNCILNQVGLAPGVYVAFAVCGVFFVAALAAMWWAFRNGEFDDIEASKFEMLDDSEDGERARQIRAAVEAARARARS
jgi:cbb3-type cytochrome oxidase maturation protein